MLHAETRTEQNAGPSFDVSDAERVLINKIAARAVKMEAANYPRGQRRRRLDFQMDLTACIANGNPLRLADLLAADDFNFAHDVYGIARHIDHQTGELRNFFSPRFSRPQAA